MRFIEQKTFLHNRIKRCCHQRRCGKDDATLIQRLRSMRYQNIRKYKESFITIVSSSFDRYF
jgi:hypothetical protein